jgi:hypothetical protein
MLANMWEKSNPHTTTMENIMETPQKTKHRTGIRSSNSTLSDIPKGM